MHSVVITGAFIILVLAIRIVSLKVQLEGVREALEQANNDNRKGSAVYGFAKALAFIGLLAMFTLCLYASLALLTLVE